MSNQKNVKGGLSAKGITHNLNALLKILFGDSTIAFEEVFKCEYIGICYRENVNGFLSAKGKT